MNHKQTRYDQPRVLRMLRTILGWCRRNFRDIAVSLATALYALAYGTQHLAGHILVHAWLRYALVRWLAATLMAIAAGFLLVLLVTMWLTWRPLTAADMAPLSGTVAAFERNEDDNRLIIELAEYGSPFLLPASSGPYFKERDFLRDVQVGDAVTISIDKHLRGYLLEHKLLVAHVIEAQGNIYLELQPVEADRQREIFQTGPFLGLAAVIILAGCGIWFYRVSRLE